jgi:hypothetical protein
MTQPLHRTRLALVALPLVLALTATSGHASDHKKKDHEAARIALAASKRSCR